MPAARVVVYDRDEVVSDVTLLLVALRVLLQVRRHQRGNVEDDLEQKKIFTTVIVVQAHRPKSWTSQLITRKTEFFFKLDFQSLKRWFLSELKLFILLKIKWNYFVKRLSLTCPLSILIISLNFCDKTEENDFRKWFWPAWRRPPTCRRSRRRHRWRQVRPETNQSVLNQNFPFNLFFKHLRSSWVD